MDYHVVVLLLFADLYYYLHIVTTELQYSYSLSSGSLATKVVRQY